MNSKTVLVIDGGGRGSVLVDKYAQSQHVGRILAVPGNDLIVELAKKPVKIFPKIKTTDIKSILTICHKSKVDLIDVAQDDAVAQGLTDVLTQAGFAVFGPTKAAAQIEWDKAWAREFMRKNSIPIPKFKICHSQSEGITFIKSQKKGEWFIKASGLAAGKGSLYAASNSQAIEQIIKMKNFGQAAKTYLIEQCLIGEEFSSFAIVDGKNFILVGHAQDHKRVFNGDVGPNTGGMGCSSPPVVITPKIEQQIQSIFKKTAEGLVKIDRPYRGVLYLGGMISNGKIYVIEFNARWGDPEAQVIIPSIKNDFYELADKIINGNLSKIKIAKDRFYRVAVTAASRGYPDDYSQVVGKQIFGLDSLLRHPDPFTRHPDPELVEGEGSQVMIFGAGVKKSGKEFLANGGRLFYVLAEGKNIVDARQKAYNALSLTYIEGNNLHYRTDIGWRDLERFYIRKQLASGVLLPK